MNCFLTYGYKKILLTIFSQFWFSPTYRKDHDEISKRCFVPWLFSLFIQGVQRLQLLVTLKIEGEISSCIIQVTHVVVCIVKWFCRHAKISLIIVGVETFVLLPSEEIYIISIFFSFFSLIRLERDQWAAMTNSWYIAEKNKRPYKSPSPIPHIS
jgi:hypothetical protein